MGVGQNTSEAGRTGSAGSSDRGVGRGPDGVEGVLGEQEPGPDVGPHAPKRRGRTLAAQGDPVSVLDIRDSFPEKSLGVGVNQ